MAQNWAVEPQEKKDAVAVLYFSLNPASVGNGHD
jgi:hypothetical protein